MKDKIINNIQKYKVIYGIIIGIILCLLLVVLKNYNPENSSILPPCLVYKFTGFQCAGCGVTRGVHYLLNFEFKKAFFLNPLIYFYIIYFIYVVIKYIVLKCKEKEVNLDSYTNSLYLALIVTITFMTVRNIINCL